MFSVTAVAGTDEWPSVWRPRVCGTDLVGEVGAQLQHPVPPLLHGHTHAPPALHGDGAQRVVGRQLYYQLNDDVLDAVSSHHFSSSSSSLNLQHTNSNICFVKFSFLFFHSKSISIG